MSNGLIISRFEELIDRRIRDVTLSNSPYPIGTILFGGIVMGIVLSRIACLCCTDGKFKLPEKFDRLHK